MDTGLSKPFKSLGPTPDYEAPTKEPGKESFKTIETEGSQGHPAKPMQPGEMRFIKK